MGGDGKGEADIHAAAVTLNGGIDKFFYSRKRRQHAELENDGRNFLEIAELMFDKTNSTLRQQEKIFGQTRLILNSFKTNQYTLSPLHFVLIYNKTMQNELYLKIESNSLTHQELCNAVINLIPLSENSKYGMNLIYIVAILLILYNNNLDHDKRITLIEKGTDDNFKSPIKIKMNDDDTKELVRLLNNIISQRTTSDISLKYLINKISLTESIILN